MPTRSPGATVRHGRADGLDDARALVSEHGRERHRDTTGRA